MSTQYRKVRARERTRVPAGHVGPGMPLSTPAHYARVLRYPDTMVQVLEYSSKKKRNKRKAKDAWRVADPLL